MKKRTVTSSENNPLSLQVIAVADLSLENARKNVSPESVAIYIRSLLQNWRQGTVACKDRSEVSYSNKKPWKQKGTGRARAGSARSPVWRGGGVVFGPQPRTRVLKTDKQVKRNALNSILFNFLDQNRVKLADWEGPAERPSTAAAHRMLKNAALLQDKVVLFLTPNDVISHASFANIPNVRILYFDQPNAFDLSNGTQWLVLKKDFEHFKKMVSQWI